ncbi:MAG: hypothetical protein WCC64_22495 [Aliidongia sp.]
MGALRERAFDQIGEVFLYAASASASSLSVILCAGHNRGARQGYAERIEESDW